MEICSFWCGSLSPQLPDSACFSVSAACFSLAGHMIRRSGQFLSSNPYPGVHPRRSPVDLYSLERFQAASIHSLCQRTPFTLFLSDCTVPARAEPHGQDQREQRYVPRQILPSPVTTMSARQCDALYRGVWRSRRAVLCRAMPCGQAGGLLRPTSAGGSRMPCTVCKADCTKMFRSHQRRRGKAWVVDRIHSGPASVR
jgi:hypothetical protein